MQADLILPAEITAARLQSNDINLLLGYDAVSAHIEEFDGDGDDDDEDEGLGLRAGRGQRMAQLLAADSSRVWPPAAVHALVNRKSNYLLKAAAAGIRIAPTEVVVPRSVVAAGQQTEAAALAYAVLSKAQRRGWRRFVVKPVPSSWGRAVTRFETAGLSWPSGLGPLEAYCAQPLVTGSEELLVQDWMAGFVHQPETRCFFWGGEFLYAVANCTVGPAGEAHCSEVAAASDCAAGPQLPEAYWRPAVEIGRALHERVLPRLVGFNGQQLSRQFLWMLRVDVGLQPTGDRPATAGGGAFLNEVEAVPTLYIDRSFRHAEDHLTAWARRCVEAAAEVVGVPVPEPNPPPDRPGMTGPMIGPMTGLGAAGELLAATVRWSAPELPEIAQDAGSGGGAAGSPRDRLRALQSRRRGGREGRRSGSPPPLPPRLPALATVAAAKQQTRTAARRSPVRWLRRRWARAAVLAAAVMVGLALLRWRGRLGLRLRPAV